MKTCMPYPSTRQHNGHRSWLASFLVGSVVALTLWLGSTAIARAAEAAPAAQDPVLEGRMLAISSELRCLVCQNQTIADSHSDLANDLRQQIREMLQSGQTEEQIRAYMTARYGEFVLYRPPVNSHTLLLWIGPALMMLGGLALLVRILRQRSRMAAEQFDPEDDNTAQDPHLS